jgi:transcriptional regulator with XRE-family HTH domain
MNHTVGASEWHRDASNATNTGTETLRPFGVRLRAMREAHGISQSELARRAGLDHSAISLFESGARPNPRLATVMAIATALELDDLNTDQLREAAGFKPRISPEVDAFRRLSPDVQRAMLAMYEQIRRAA